MFAQRRQRFLDAMGPDAVAFFVGASLAVRSNDTHFPFRQDSDFLYLTGFDHPDAVAVLRTDGGPAFTLFVQPRDRSAEVWNGYRPGVEGARSDYDADEAHPIENLPEELPKIIERARQIHHVLGRNEKLDRQLIESLGSLRQRSKQGLLPASQILDPRDIVHEMRLIKDEAELELMRRAAGITAEAHRAAAALAHSGRYEYELEAALGHVFRMRGGSGPAYGPIVASGANATTLHYVANDQSLRDGALVLIDAGAELEGYAADVTRTYPIGGRFGAAHRAVYEVVLSAQLTGLDRCRPGITLPEIHDAVVRRLTEGLVELGLLEGEVDKLVEDDAFRTFYMHGTSHWLGLDVHDCGIYARGEIQRKLEPGMVFTVEPGLYIATDCELEIPNEFRGIGVRIEDDVLITTGGHENLSARIPKQPEAVEAWVQDN